MSDPSGSGEPLHDPGLQAEWWEEQEHLKTMSEQNEELLERVARAMWESPRPKSIVGGHGAGRESFLGLARAAISAINSGETVIMDRGRVERLRAMSLASSDSWVKDFVLDDDGNAISTAYAFQIAFEALQPSDTDPLP